MRLVRPSVEIWEQGTTLDDMWKHIARCTRVCYQSTPKKDGETDEEFVKRVILHNISDMNTLSCNFEKLHGAMLEHGTVYLMAIDWDRNPLRHYWTNKYSRVKQIHLETEHCQSDTSYKYAYYVTTNLRVIYEHNWLDDLKYICAPTEHHARRITACFTTNIGVTREFNRHRVNSPAEESTRYCNYSKKNDGQLNIGLPAWFLDDEHLPYLEAHAFDGVGDYASGILSQEDDEIVNTWCDMDFYLCAITFCQWCYNMLIKKGWSAQQAREVLPLATKSQLVHTAFVDDWRHFFSLRAFGASGAPHPNAELVARPLYEEFVKHGYIGKL